VADELHAPQDEESSQSAELPYQSNLLKFLDPKAQDKADDEESKCVENFQHIQQMIEDLDDSSEAQSAATVSDKKPQPLG